MMRIVTLFLCAFAATAAELDTSESQDKEKSQLVSTKDGVANLAEEDSSLKGKILFGSYSTATYTMVSAVTSTVFFSCVSGTDATVCAGRNARRFKRKASPEDIPFSEKYVEGQEIDSSLDNPNFAPGEEADIPKGQSKLAFTIWTTSRTTTSVTLFYTNTATTIRLSYYCVAGGIQLPTRNCAG